MDLQTLLGMCSTLEEGGFTILGSSELNRFKKIYGDLLPKGDGSSSSSSFDRPSRPSFISGRPGTTIFGHGSIPTISNSVDSDSDSDSDPDRDRFNIHKKKPGNNFKNFGSFSKNPFLSKKHSNIFNKKSSSSSQEPIDNSIEHFDGPEFISSPRLPASTVAIRPPMPAMGASVVPGIPMTGINTPILIVGQPVVGKNRASGAAMSSPYTLTPTHMTAFSPPFITVDGSITVHNDLDR